MTENDTEKITTAMATPKVKLHIKRAPRDKASHRTPGVGPTTGPIRADGAQGLCSQLIVVIENPQENRMVASDF